MSIINPIDLTVYSGSISVSLPVNNHGGISKLEQISNTLASALPQEFKELKEHFDSLKTRAFHKKNINRREVEIPQLSKLSLFNDLNELEALLKAWDKIPETTKEALKKFSSSRACLFNELQGKERESLESQEFIAAGCPDKIEEYLNHIDGNLKLGETSISNIKQCLSSLNAREDLSHDGVINLKVKLLEIVKKSRESVESLSSDVEERIKSLAPEIAVFSSVKTSVDDSLQQLESSLNEISASLQNENEGVDVLIKINGLINSIKNSHSIQKIEYHLCQQKIEEVYARPLLLMHGRVRILKTVRNAFAQFASDRDILLKEPELFKEIKCDIRVDYNIKACIKEQEDQNPAWIQKNLSILDQYRSALCSVYHEIEEKSQDNIREAIKGSLKGKAMRDTVLECQATSETLFVSPFRLEMNPNIYFDEKGVLDVAVNKIVGQIFPVLTKRTAPDFDESSSKKAKISHLLD